MMTATSRNVPRAPMKRGPAGGPARAAGRRSGRGLAWTAQWPDHRGPGHRLVTGAPERLGRAERSNRIDRVERAERSGRDDSGEHARAEALTVSFAESHQDEGEGGVRASRRLDMHKDGNGFSVGLPKGWYVERRNGEAGAVPQPERLGELPDDRVRRQGGFRPEEGLGAAGALQQGQLPRLQADPDREGRLHGEGRRLGVHLERQRGQGPGDQPGVHRQEGRPGLRHLLAHPRLRLEEEPALFEGFAKTFSSKK